MCAKVCTTLTLEEFCRATISDQLAAMYNKLCTVESWLTRNQVQDTEKNNGQKDSLSPNLSIVPKVDSAEPHLNTTSGVRVGSRHSHTSGVEVKMTENTQSNSVEDNSCVPPEVIHVLNTTGEVSTVPPSTTKDSNGDLRFMDSNELFCLVMNALMTLKAPSTRRQICLFITRKKYNRDKLSSQEYLPVELCLKNLIQQDLVRETDVEGTLYYHTII